MVDVELVDARGVHRRHRPGDAMVLDALRQDFAAGRRQELGIAQAADAVVGIENHRAGNHRPEECAAPDLVHARYQRRARSPRLLLELQGALQALEQAHFRRGGRNLFHGFQQAGHRKT